MRHVTVDGKARVEHGTAPVHGAAPRMMWLAPHGRALRKLKCVCRIAEVLRTCSCAQCQCCIFSTVRGKRVPKRFRRIGGGRGTSGAPGSPSWGAARAEGCVQARRVEVFGHPFRGTASAGARRASAGVAGLAGHRGQWQTPFSLGELAGKKGCPKHITASGRRARVSAAPERPLPQRA